MREGNALSLLRAKVKLRGGEELGEMVVEAIGSPSNPMSLDQRREKIGACASQNLPRSARRNEQKGRSEDFRFERGLHYQYTAVFNQRWT